MSSWTLRARAHNLTGGAIIDDWSATLVERFNLPDTLQVTGRTDNLRPLFALDGGATLNDESGRRFSGPLASMTRNGDGTCTLTFESDLIWLWGRIVYPDPTAAITPSQTAGYDTRTGPAESVALGFINWNAGPAAIAARRVLGLTVPASFARGGTTTVRGRLDVLGRLVADIGEAAALRFRVMQSGAGLEVQVSVAPDLTATAKYGTSEAGGPGLLGEDWSWQVDRPPATRYIVGGGGVGPARDYVEVADPAAETRWGGRIEAFHDGHNEFSETENAYNDWREAQKDQAAAKAKWDIALAKFAAGAAALSAAEHAVDFAQFILGLYPSNTNAQNNAANAGSDYAAAASAQAANTTAEDHAHADYDAATATVAAKLAAYNTARAAYLVALNDAGAADLADAANPVQINAPVLDGPGLRLVTGVPLGSLVTLDLDGQPVVDRLRQVTTVIGADDNAPTVTVTGLVGSPDAGLTRSQKEFLDMRRKLRKVVTW